MYRKTYANIYLDNIKDNVSNLIGKYNNYDYYFGVVKADCYGHNDLKTVKKIIAGGCNYLAVSSLEEALRIRKEISIPILCLGIVSPDDIELCIKKNITITVNSYEFAKKIKISSKLKIHLKLNTGMNRLGISNIEELDSTYELLKNCNIEGIFTHIAFAEDKEESFLQFEKFENMVRDYKHIPIIHIANSETLENYEKLSFVNGCRMGIIMYGFGKEEFLKSTIDLRSTVIQINELSKGDKLGYNYTHTALGDERIAVVAIGYADGVIRKNKGRDVFINDKRYKIVGNVCMDMLFVKVDESVKVGDEVIILKDVSHIEEVAKYLETIPYEVICGISNRVFRKYI